MIKDSPFPQEIDQLFSHLHPYDIDAKLVPANRKIDSFEIIDSLDALEEMGLNPVLEGNHYFIHVPRGWSIKRWEQPGYKVIYYFDQNHRLKLLHRIEIKNGTPQPQLDHDEIFATKQDYVFVPQWDDE